MQKRCDVIVVGAGPAGSTAARYAAEEGLAVLLIDKRKEIGVPVCCGEFNPTPAVLAEALPDAPGIDELFPADPGLVQRTIRGFVVTSPKGREYEFDLDGCTVNRDAFDRHLADAAVRAGAVLSSDTKFLSWEDRRVATTMGEVEAGFVPVSGPMRETIRENRRACGGGPPVTGRAPFAPMSESDALRWAENFLPLRGRRGWLTGF